MKKIVKIRPQSGSLMVVIPKEMTDALNLEKGASVMITLQDNKMIIEEVK